MVKLEESVEKALNEENPQSIAVKSLININPRDLKHIETDVELKTDLNENDVNTHTILSLLNHVLNNKEDFSKRSIIGDLITIRERKLISKDRKGRGEIVELAKTPENPILAGTQDMGMLQKFFTSKRDRI